MDLLVHNLVDLFHVVKHLIGLLVQIVQLLLVILELDLAIVHFLARVVLQGFSLEALHDVHLIVHILVRVERRVLVLPVVHLNSLLALDLNWPTEFLDVAREGLSEHL